MSEHQAGQIDWSRLIAVTNRRLCRESFWERLEKIACRRPRAIILREKDLTEQAYRSLAAKAITVSRAYGVPLLVHGWPQAAAESNADGLHLPLPVLRRLSADERQRWKVLGTSCHSIEDVCEAQRLGCSYLIAGHIYETDCKKGLPGRGLSFLQAACKTSPLPVLAIGGITPERLPAVLAAGAAGACIMSGLMRGETWFGKNERGGVQDEP